MDNREIASILKEIAVYQELGGENPFKLRAFEQAARIIETHSENIEAIARQGRLTDIKGIGKGLAEAVESLVETGRSSILDELRSSFPDGLTELLSIPGMGPQKVKTVWKDLGITTLGELEYACVENRLISLKGFGEKSQKRILDGILFRKKFASQFLYSDALVMAEEIVANLAKTEMFRVVEPAGSLRRGKTVFKDIDILLVPSEDSEIESVRTRLLALADEADGVTSAGDTKVSIRRGGLPVDFRIVPLSSYPAALQHFTGSRQHNTALRSLAKERNLKINEYGVFKDGDTSEPLIIGEEKDVYGSVGLSWIPPELREDQGEVEAAEKGILPQLVVPKDFHGMIHVHSHYSDGLNSITDLAEECIRQGYSYLCLSDHSRTAFYAGGLAIDKLKEQRREVEKINADMAPFRIFCGIESDILADGNLDYPDEVLQELDFIIASVHSNLRMDSDSATKRLLAAISNPYISILGHPSGRLLLSREGYAYDENRVFDALVERGIALEHNCNPHRLDPDWQCLKRAAERGIKISVNPDAHDLTGFGDMRFGITMARKAWLTSNDVLNCMEAEQIDEYFRQK